MASRSTFPMARFRNIVNFEASEIGTFAYAAIVCASMEDRQQSGSATICHWGGLSQQEAHREIRTTDVCSRGSIVVAGFGGRSAVCLRVAPPALPPQPSPLFGTRSCEPAPP